MQTIDTWSKGEQRVQLKGHCYKDIIVQCSGEGLRLTSASNPQYLNRLIPWESMSNVQVQRCDNNYFLKEYWNWILSPTEYSGLLPRYRNMVSFTYDDKQLMELHVVVHLNVDDETFHAIDPYVKR